MPATSHDCHRGVRQLLLFTGLLGALVLSACGSDYSPADTCPTGQRLDSEGFCVPN
jgi:hypothetical protein